MSFIADLANSKSTSPSASSILSCKLNSQTGITKKYRSDSASFPAASSGTTWSKVPSINCWPIFNSLCAAWSALIFRRFIATAPAFPRPLKTSPNPPAFPRGIASSYSQSPSGSRMVCMVITDPQSSTLTLQLFALQFFNYNKESQQFSSLNTCSCQASYIRTPALSKFSSKAIWLAHKFIAMIIEIRIVPRAVVINLKTVCKSAKGDFKLD